MLKEADGYNDQSVFFGIVFTHSCFPHESWALTMERLEAAIRNDAAKDGEEPRMSPRMVTRAYRRHPSLSRLKAEVDAEWRRRQARRTDLPCDHPLVIGEPRRKVEWPTEAQTGLAMKIAARDAVDAKEIKGRKQNEDRLRGMAAMFTQLETNGVVSHDYSALGKRMALQFYRSAHKYMRDTDRLGD